MSRIDELIAEHAPSGVPIVPLKQVSRTVPGLTGKTKADFTDGNARFISYKNAFANIAVDQESPDFVKVGLGEKQNRLCEGDVIFTGSSESLDEVGMSSVVMSEPREPLYLNSFCFAVRFDSASSMLPGFSKHLFRSESIRSQIKRSASGVTRINVSKDRFLKTRIPIPPLQVQREITRILDTFTELEAELEAELEGRRRQYAHYADALIADADLGGAPWVALEDLATFKYGLTARAADEGQYRFIRITDITPDGKLSARDAKYIDAQGDVTDYLVRAGDLLMARTGATYAKTMLAPSHLEAVFASFLIRIRVDRSRMIPAYYWHFSQSGHFWRQANALVSRGGQPQFNANVLRTVEVPVPSLEEQQRIVALLESFDALVSDLSVGLPAELAARRQQYEYYRDRLLTFEEIVS